MNENTRETWNRMADNYQAVFRLGLNEYNTALLHFWQEEKMLFPGARVLDIGCGVGKYGTYLAKLGYDVTLTDISDEMLRHAERNMAPFSTPWAVYRCDFNEVTGQEEVFAKGFDLTISTMSPAIHDAQTVLKMSSMTHGWCFIARFYDWEQPFRNQLMEKIGFTPKQQHNDFKNDCAAMVQMVSEAGYVPMVKYVDYNWSDARTPEEMAEYMSKRFFDGEEDIARLRTKTMHAAQMLADKNGNVHDNVNTKVSWIYWKTKGE